MAQFPRLIKALTPITSRVRTDITAKRTPTGSVWTKEPLSDELLHKHHNGGPYRGCCPIKAGESVTLIAVLDLDSHGGETSWDGMVAAAILIMDELELIGHHPLAFRSTGGKGIHIYLLWEQPQDAYSVRMMLRGVLEQCKLHEGANGVASGEVEIFPKQDNVPLDGHGNMFILPLAGESVPLSGSDNLKAMDREYVTTMEWPLCPTVEVLQAPPKSSSTATVDLDTLKSALDAIPNCEELELDFDHWRDVIFAIHHTTGGSAEGLELAHAFSAKSIKYDKEFLEQRTWRYIKGRDDGITGRTVIALAEEHGWTDPAEVFGEVVVIPSDDTPPKLRRDKNGKILATVENLASALRKPGYSGIQIKFDQFRDEIMFAPPVSDQWAAFSDPDYTRLRITLENKGFKPVGREIIRDVVLLIANENQFDSAIAWLGQQHWDGVQRVEPFLAHYFGVEDTEYSRAVSRYLWTAMAGRVLKPGIKTDMVPILVGEQGAGKSSAVAAMVPDQEFFCEISFSEKEDDLSRKMRGRLIAEIGELRGLHTKELEAIKAFITRTHENWIPKYREFATQFPRRLVFIGTTNKDEFLADETGNRRWLPVKVGQVDVAGIKADCLQLWAEAAVLFGLSGVEYSQAEKLSGEAHIEHTMGDPWAELVSEWLDKEDPYTGIVPRTCKFLQTTDVLKNAIGVDAKNVSIREEKRIAAVLKQLGYTRKKMRVGKATLWVFAL